MFYALATKKIRSPFVEVRHLLDDIQTLNVKARQGAYELTAISYHAYPYVADKYALMAAGSSIGDNYGPMVVANRPMAVEDLKGKRIAIPGLMTTAYLTLKLMQPDFEPLVVPFDKILDAVHDQAADAGLIIHEAQLTFAKAGFHNVIDLGRWWRRPRGACRYPSALTCSAATLSPEVTKEACRLMRESIQYALDHRDEALAYAMQFARDMEAPLAERCGGMYVNHYTVDCGVVVPKAAQKLLDMGFEAGIIPHQVTGWTCAVKPVILLVLATTFGFSQTAPPAAEPKQRIRAVRDLAKSGVDSIPKIAPYLSDPDVSVRVETVKALIDIGGPRTVEPLVTATKDNDAEIQIRAAEGLVNAYLPGYVKGGVSGSLQRAGDAVRAKFGASNDQVIDAFVTVRPEVISALGRQLCRGGASWESRAAAARAVGVLRGRAALDDLVEAVHSKEDQLMFEALIAIQKIRDPSAGPRIAFRLHDLDDRIQIATLDTTGILRNQAAAPEVADVFDHARDAKVKHSAAQALAQLARPADRAYFVVWLNDRDDVIRAAGAEGLGRLKIPTDRPTLDKALAGERSMNVRLAVVFGLVAQGNLDTSELSPLRYLINTLNVKASKEVASAYLMELARDTQVRRTIQALVPTAAKGEKLGLSAVLAMSGDRDSVPVLETLSMDPDSEVAQEGLRDLRTLRARLP